MAKSIRGIGKYGDLNKAQLIDKIIKTKKPKTKTQPQPKPKIQPKPKPQIQPKPKKENTYEELNQLSFNELRKMAKSIRGIGKYGDLNKAQLIDKIIKTKKPVIITKEKNSTIIPVPAPRTKKKKKEKIRKRPVPAPRTKKSYILDEPIPEKEIPKGQKILKPSMEKKIKKVVKFGKKQVENWGEWLMKVDVPQIVVDDEIKSLKRKISDFYKKKLPKQYEIIKIGEKSSPKFNTFYDIFKIEPNQSTEIDLGKVLLEIANRVIYQRVLKDGDKIRWILSHPSWNNPISTKLITISGSISANDLINELVNFVEYKEVPLSEVKIEIQSINIPRGMGRLHVMNSNLKQKTSVITIKNDDSICLARAIVTAVANINKTQWTKTQLKDGFNKSRKLQKIEAEKLHKEAGVEINEFGSTLEDVKKFAEHLKIQINIVDAECFNELILTTEKPDVNSQMIYLYKNKNHFDVITSMTGFLCKSYYCHSCKKSYKKRNCHKCPNKCLACFKYFKNGNKCSGEEIICRSCNRSFFGQACFNEHKRDRSKKIVKKKRVEFEYIEVNGLKFKKNNEFKRKLYIRINSKRNA